MLKKYYLITYGCQMNKSDNERIAAVLEKSGHKPAKNESGADLLVINMCSVRQSAVERAYAKINKYFKTKKIILAGCILKKDKIILKDKVAGFWHPSKYFECQPLYQNKFSAFVPISTGCNNFCSYCVVPYVRGKEISRPAEDIINEVKSLAKKGYKEIVLIGQNVNSYISRIINFPQLLRMINDIPGNFWLRFITSHPKDMSDELIETMAKCQKVCEYVHLPIQSGDNQILKKMNRHYTAGHYKNLIKKIRTAFRKYRPNGLSPAISTDIIVGFPSETKKQFENTAKLMKEIKFDMAYIAKYSPRPGTAAAKMKDSISPAEKKRREKVLTEILKKTALVNNKKYVGKTVKILIEEIRDGFLLGKTRSFKTVKIEKENRNLKIENRIGKIVKVKITNADSFGLKVEYAKN